MSNTGPGGGLSRPDSAAAPPRVPLSTPAVAQLLQRLSTAKVAIDARHATWLKNPMDSGVVRRIRFWEGKDTVFTPTASTTETISLPRRAANFAELGSRDWKKQRYFELDRAGLDSGLHEFIRSVQNHYCKAWTAHSKVAVGQPPPKERAEAIVAYAQYYHDLAKARRYLTACQQLALFCYGEVGVVAATPDGSSGWRVGSLLDRVGALLPDFHAVFGDIVSAPLEANPGRAIDVASLLAPRTATVGRSRQFVEALTKQLADQKEAAFQRQQVDAMNKDSRAAQNPSAFLIDTKIRLFELDDPGLAKQIRHYATRMVKEKDRLEKVFAFVDVAFSAAKTTSIVGVTVDILGVAVKPIKTALWPVTKLCKVAMQALFPEDWMKSRKPTDVVVLAGPDLVIVSAAECDESQLQAMAVGVDEKIIAAARHIHDAAEHLDELDALRRKAAAPIASAAPAAGTSQVSPTPEQVLPEVVAIISPIHAGVYYEFAHDVDKALQHLAEAAAFELSLGLAVAALEAELADSFHALDTHVSGAL